MRFPVLKVCKCRPRHRIEFAEKSEGVSDILVVKWEIP